jgi:hydrogenase maturation protease
MAKVTVLGIGNILLRDEGVGVRLMEALRDCRCCGEDVEFIDGGAGGLSLISILEQAQTLIVLDAAEMRLEPGAFRVIEPAQLQEDRPQSLSLHDMPFAGTLELCRQYASVPRRVRIFAIQPESIEYGRELSKKLTTTMPLLVEAVKKLIEEELAR